MEKHPKHRKFTKAQKVKITKDILEMYKDGIHTLTSCCEAKGVNPSSFFKWKCSSSGRHYVAEVERIFKEATEVRDFTFKAKLKDGARGALLRLITGHTYEEVTTEVKQDADGTTKPVSIKKVKKEVQPNATAVIFALKNTDSETFKDEVQNTGVITHNHTYGDLSDEELEAELEKAKKQLGEK